MANTVFKLRRSTVAGKWPNTSTLAIGELAINLTDRKLFSSDGANTFEIGSNVSVIHAGNIYSQTLNSNTIYTGNVEISDTLISHNVEITGALSAANSYGNSGLFLTSNGTAVYWASPSATIDIPHIIQTETGNGVKTNYAVTGGYDANNLSVFVNGARMTDQEANVASGSNVVFTTAPVNGSTVEFIGYTLDPSDGAYVKANFTGDGVTDEFLITGGYTPNYLNVFLNGVRASNSEIDISSGSSVIFNTPPANSSIIDVIGVTSLNPLASFVSDSFVADGVSNTFNATHVYDANHLLVYLNGIKLSSSELTLNGATIVFNTAPANGAIVDTYGIYTGVDYQIANQNATFVWTNNHTFTNTVTFQTPPIFPSNTAAVWSVITGTNGQMISVSDASPNGAMAFWSHGSGWRYVANNGSI